MTHSVQTKDFFCFAKCTDKECTPAIANLGPDPKSKCCDNTREASGGPMFAYWDNQPTIYAPNMVDFRNDSDTSLILSQYTDQNANIAT
jgi:hypothetical protein